MKLEITKEKVLKASETCPDAKGVLKELFPEVFKGKEREENITEKIKWHVFEFNGEYDEGYWLMGEFEGKDYFYFNVDGFHFNHDSYEEKFRFIQDDTCFRILKKN